MGLKNDFIAALKQESESTRRMLERIPENDLDWRPHVKSMSIGRLSEHLAELPLFVNRIMNQDFYVISGVPPLPKKEQKGEILSLFSETLSNALSSLEKSNESSFEAIWELKMGEKVIMSIPRKDAIRSLVFGHFIHHRGQLSVYLRLLDIPVPGVYGPSADEK